MTNSSQRCQHSLTPDPLQTETGVSHEGPSAGGGANRAGQDGRAAYLQRLEKAGGSIRMGHGEVPLRAGQTRADDTRSEHAGGGGG